MKKWKPYILVVWFCLLVAACGEDDNTTQPEDTPVSPLASMFPQSNATDVPLDVVVTATFKEDMDSLTINETTFTLQYNPPVSGTVTYDKDTRTATFTPDSLLQHSTTYTATITTGAKNTSGTPLASDFSWGFTTIIPGQGQVFLARTGQTARYAAGDDGDIETGVAWPTPRFIDNMDGTVTDELTGLMWLKDGECLGIGIWQGEAYHAIDSLNFDPRGSGCQDYTRSYQDWRLPNVNELESLVHAGQHNTSTWLNSLVFTGVQARYYWTSTTNPQALGSAWCVNMWNGPVDPQEKRFYQRLWAVRGETSQPALVWTTGQVTSHRPRDDGDLQEGAPWPRPRFFFSSNVVSTDLLTGLVWLRDAGTSGTGNCDGGTKTWQEALDYIECLNSNNYLGVSDWRLPNRKELFSLIDREQRNPPLPSDHYFQDVQLGYYWTSTTYAFETHRAWVVGMRVGDVGPRDKTGNAWVWPVRGGR
jgi:hypothetical protein